MKPVFNFMHWNARLRPRERKSEKKVRDQAAELTLGRRNDAAVREFSHVLGKTPSSRGVLKPVRVLSSPSGSVFRKSHASIGGDLRASGKSVNETTEEPVSWVGIISEGQVFRRRPGTEESVIGDRGRREEVARGKQVL